MSDLDIENICRLCCEKKNRMRSLFDLTVNDSTSLKQVILDVTRLEVDIGDGMPQKICRMCTSTLMKMHETIENYRENNLKLQQQISAVLQQQVEIKEEEVDEEDLEKACHREMLVDNIDIKEEQEAEYIDYEELEQTKECSDNEVSANVKADDSEINPFDENDEGMPEEENKEIDPKRDKPRVKKSRKPIGLSAPWKPAPKRPKKRNPDAPQKSDHKCYVCRSDSHGSAQALLAHLNSNHLNLLPYTCQECVMDTVVIKTALALNSHKRQHLNPEKCPFCDKRYSCKNNVDMHVQLHHAENTSESELTCKHCGKVFATKTSLNHHMKLHTTATSCELCGKIFAERSKLQRHIQRFHEKLRNFECHICKKKLVSLESVQNHVKAYHSTRKYKCSYCSKTFGTELAHRFHEKRHVNNPDFEPKKDWKDYYTVIEGDDSDSTLKKLKKCTLCGVITRAITTHLSAVHFPTEHRCETCGMTFKIKQIYNIHVREHENGKAERCPICGKEFSERKNLYSHLRTKKHRDNPLAQQILSTVRPKKLTGLWGMNFDSVEEQTHE
ncbi:zinc finger protein 700-like isoform X1 [Armigeres subalbatus]|uniref:zinc finger protein 700-like isoform X1 n=1 Tax=Armigeres subalbatus TaxID=124917 RepID=UPI002ED10A00